MEDMLRNKRAKFVELAESRVNRAIKDMRLIGNLSNRSAYAYSDDDIRRIFKALQKELDSAKSRFAGDAEVREEGFRLG